MTYKRLRLWSLSAWNGEREKWVGSWQRREKVGKVGGNGNGKNGERGRKVLGWMKCSTKLGSLWLVKVSEYSISWPIFIWYMFPKKTRPRHIRRLHTRRFIFEDFTLGRQEMNYDKPMMEISAVSNTMTTPRFDLSASHNHRPNKFNRIEKTKKKWRVGLKKESHSSASVVRVSMLGLS